MNLACRKLNKGIFSKPERKYLYKIIKVSPGELEAKRVPYNRAGNLDQFPAHKVF